MDSIKTLYKRICFYICLPGLPARKNAKPILLCYIILRIMFGVQYTSSYQQGWKVRSHGSISSIIQYIRKHLGPYGILLCERVQQHSIKIKVLTLKSSEIVHTEREREYQSFIKYEPNIRKF